MDAIYDEWLSESEKAGIKDVVEERTAYFDEVYGS